MGGGRLVALGVVAAALLTPLLAFGKASDPGFVLGAPVVIGVLILFSAILLHRTRGQLESMRDEATKEKQFLISLVLAGLIARIAVAAAIRAVGIQAFLAPDEGTFHINGYQFSLWLAGESPYMISVKFQNTLQVGYFYLVGVFYHVFGVHRFPPILLNCLVGALAAVPVYRIASHLGGVRAARPAAILVTFFPSVLLWSTLLIRDSLVVLVLLSILATVMELRVAFSTRGIAKLLILFVALGLLRQYLFLVLAGMAALSFVVGRTGRTGRTIAVGVVAVLALAALMHSSGFGVGELERASLEQLNMQRRYNSNAADAKTSIMPEVDISTPKRALFYLPIGIVYFLFSPFPWQVLSVRQALAIPDVLLWYGLLPTMFLGLRSLVRHRFRDAVPLLALIACITVLYALVEGNVGIIFRHRAQVIAPMMVIAGVGLAVRRAKKEGGTAADVLRS